MFINICIYTEDYFNKALADSKRSVEPFKFACVVFGTITSNTHSLKIGVDTSVTLTSVLIHFDLL